MYLTERETVDTTDNRTGVRTDGVTSLSHGVESLLQSNPVKKEQYGQTAKKGEVGTGSKLGLQVDVDKHSDDEGSCKERLKVDSINHVWDDEEGDGNSNQNENETEEEEEEGEEEGEEEEEGDEEDGEEEEGDTQEGQYYEELQEEQEEDVGAESGEQPDYKGQCSESDSNSELNSESNEEKRSEAEVQESPHLRYITPWKSFYSVVHTDRMNTHSLSHSKTLSVAVSLSHSPSVSFSLSLSLPLSLTHSPNPHPSSLTFTPSHPTPRRDGSPFYDEWENDDDTGYVYVRLSEEEFFSIVEEVSALCCAELWCVTCDVWCGVVCDVVYWVVVTNWKI